MSSSPYISSCIRSQQLRELLLAGSPLRGTLPSPQAGDLVVVEVTGSEGAYTELETAPDGSNKALAPGATFVGVLANRFSGVNPYGVLPEGSLSHDDQLHLLSIAGVLGRAIHVPHYQTSKALPLRILGFPTTRSGDVANTSAHAPLARQRADLPSGLALLTVCGSSAEVGKTSMMEALIRASVKLAPAGKLAALKLCGTGRLKDRDRYTAAGAAWAADFVDAGVPSTYGLDDDALDECLTTLLGAAAHSGCKFQLLEIGGDLLEAGAPTLLRKLSVLQSPAVFIAGDALAASFGLSILRDLGIKKIFVASLRQNSFSLAKRLHLDRCFEVGPAADAEQIVRAIAW